ncbi:MAG: LysM peptidoglycan-binding domain-containing protein [Clostridia bacterium]|nr:LysM peptidoglycan-binding domain-containing protein [Clostridia bacterium]
MTKTKKRTVIVNRARFFVFLTLAVVVFNVMFLYAYNPSNTQADAVNKTETITVFAGDTIWSIAEEYGNEHEDIRNTIYKIKKLNNMKNAELKVGQSLLVPTV